MPTITLAQLREKALARCEGNSTFYTSDEVDWVINEALRTLNLFTGFYRLTVQLAGYSVANQLVYDTPSAIMAPRIIYFEGRQLQKLDLRSLARARRNWATDTTALRGRVDYWAPIGARKFVITPIDSTGGRDMAVTGIGETPVLSNASDLMTIENEYVEIVTEYCAHRLPLKVGGKIFADGSLALNTFYKVMQERLQYESYKNPARYHLIEPKKEATANVA